MPNPYAGELKATFKVSLSSGDTNNPLPDLTTASSIVVYQGANTWTATAPSAGIVQWQTTVPATPGIQPTEILVTWPDGGTSKSVFNMTIQAAQV